MVEKWNLQCPKLKIHKGISRNVSFLDTSPNISHSFQDIHQYMTNLWKFCVHSIMRYQHYNDVIMGAMTYQITSLTIVYSTVYSDADQRKHQSSASLAFVRGIHRGPVNSPHTWPVTRNIFPFDDVIMWQDNAPWVVPFCHCFQLRDTSKEFLNTQKNSHWFTM